MDDPELDQLLGEYRVSPRRHLPSNFDQGVWRKIRQDKAGAASRAGFSISSWILRPQIVTAVLAVAILTGVGIGSRATQTIGARTQSALNLEVFGNEAPALPSTLLADNL